MARSHPYMIACQSSMRVRASLQKRKLISEIDMDEMLQESLVLVGYLMDPMLVPNCQCSFFPHNPEFPRVGNWQMRCNIGSRLQSQLFTSGSASRFLTTRSQRAIQSRSRNSTWVVGTCILPDSKQIFVGDHFFRAPSQYRVPSFSHDGFFVSVMRGPI